MYSKESKLTCFARSLESLVEGHNWFLNQFVEIPRRSISFGKRRFKPLTIWDPRRYDMNGGGTTWKGDLKCWEVKTGWDKCKPVLLRLSLAGNMEKPLTSLNGSEWKSVAMDSGDLAERDKCRPVLPRLSLAGNLEKPPMSLYGTEWTEVAWLWTLMFMTNVSAKKH